MNDIETKQMIFGILKKIAPDTTPEELLPNDNVQRILDIDSYDYLQFIVALSEKIGRDIPEEDYGKITTLDNLLLYLKK